jgi:hypothetical protein
MERFTGFDQVARQYGFVVAYLGSTSSVQAWWTSYDPNFLSYINSMIDQLKVSQNIDRLLRRRSALLSGRVRAWWQDRGDRRRRRCRGSASMYDAPPTRLCADGHGHV